MLVLDNLDAVHNEELQGLLTEFRKVQVSRYPIELVVGSSNQLIGFMDSRFRTDRFNPSEMVGMIHWEKEAGFSLDSKPIYKYVIESRLIQNDKFSSHNSDYRTRKTTDIKKLFKYMKEYLKPFSHQEIAQRSFRTADNAFEDWKSDMYRNFRRIASVNDIDVLMEDLIQVKRYGLENASERFKKMMNEGVSAYEEYKEIKSKKFSRVHVYISPDEAVTVTTMPNGTLEAGVQIHESIDKAPEIIQQHVGMLRMTDNKAFVPYVGMKISDTEFWIEGLS